MKKIVSIIPKNFLINILFEINYKAEHYHITSKRAYVEVYTGSTTVYESWNLDVKSLFQTFFQTIPTNKLYYLAF
jgi:hypothetical protein